jgi:hypothetical protein
MEVKREILQLKGGKQKYVYGYEGPKAVPARPCVKGGLERR